MTEQLYPDRFRDMSPERLAELRDTMAYNETRFTRNYKVGLYEPNFTIMDVMINGAYELGETKFRIDDPVWGVETIGDKPYDQMLLELARTPAFRRTQAIEQLTLGAEYATMPNSMYFSRWQHIWGSLVFVRKMTADDSRFDDRQRMVYQLRTLLSDIGHTAFSHLGDWMFQGDQGGEDMHDKELKELLKITGISDIIEKHGFSVDEVVFPDVEDWVECKSPNLCVDRVDYALREMTRWMPGILSLWDYKKALEDPKQLFEITEDKQLAVKNKQFARRFAAGFSLLPTEHWGHPVHRLMLQLLQIAVKNVVVNDISRFGEHPRDIMYGVDSDFEGYFKTWNALHFDKLLGDIALSQRKIFMHARHPELKSIFSKFVHHNADFPAFPDPLKSYTWQSAEYGGPYPAQVEIRRSEDSVAVAGIKATRNGIRVTLPSLKQRKTDPLIKTMGGYKTLSELDPTFVRYQEGQKAQMAKTYAATLLVRPAVAKIVERRTQEINDQWEQALRSPQSSDTRRRYVSDAMFAAAARRFDDIREVDDREILEIGMGKVYRLPF